MNIWWSGSSTIKVNADLGLIKEIQGAGSMLRIETDQGLTILAPVNPDNLRRANKVGAEGLARLAHHTWWRDRQPDPPGAA